MTFLSSYIEEGISDRVSCVNSIALAFDSFLGASLIPLLCVRAPPHPVWPWAQAHGGIGGLEDTNGRRWSRSTQWLAPPRGANEGINSKGPKRDQ